MLAVHLGMVKLEGDGPVSILGIDFLFHLFLYSIMNDFSFPLNISACSMWIKWPHVVSSV